MIRFVSAVLLLCFGATVRAQDPFPQFEKRVHTEGEKKLPYRLLVPKAYKPGTVLPLIVWLHGSGEKGADNVAPLRALDKTVLADAEKCPAFVLVPQCPAQTAWHAVGYGKVPEVTEPSRMLAVVIEGLVKEFGLDGCRIYLGGFSMGGCGTWELLTRYPDLFAAAFPIAGPPFAGKPGERPGLAAVVKHVPIWAFHGDRDGVAPVDGTRAIVDALKKERAEVKYTEYKGGGHECASTLKDPKLVEWLLAQKRAADPSFRQAKVPESAALIVKTLPEGEKGTWTGKVERTGQGAARLPIDNVRYRLKPAKDAAPGVADLLAKIGKGEVTGEYTVTGTVELSEYAWLLVEKIEPKK
jgi:poly(3-hydroxybutyrate) depolymerase